MAYLDIDNPFYFVVGGRAAASDALAVDPDAILNEYDNDWGFIFSCKSTFHEMKYQVINGTFLNGSLSQKGNVSTISATNAIWTFTNYMAYTQNALETAFMSGAHQFNTTQEFGNYIGQRFSQTMLSMVAAITVPTRNIAEQTRAHLLVTRLPKAPFFALIILNLLYALLGIILAIIALASQPRKVRNIQARLSIAGLVAALLEPNPTKENDFTMKESSSGVEGLFAEHYSEDKHPENGRILVNPRAGNAAFEKVLVETNVADDKGNSSVGSSTETPSHGEAVSLARKHLAGAGNPLPQVTKSNVKRKPIAHRQSL